ncbi:hypothetical protein ACH5AO_08795 [Streptomyces sp. NPDC018964]|uniref:hypothetical protein n=1 Tax=unclassified Streptomyces TaxID=2593676 RepID=UPI0037A50137
MLTWVLDLGSAVLLSGLEGAALVAFWFVEGLKQWARGGPVPGAARRFFLVVSGGAVSSAAIGHGLWRAGLRVAAVSQAVLAVLLALALVLDAVTGAGRRKSRYRLRRRLRRERRHASRGGNGQVEAARGAPRATESAHVCQRGRKGGGGRGGSGGSRVRPPGGL